MTNIEVTLIKLLQNNSNKYIDNIMSLISQPFHTKYYLILIYVLTYFNYVSLHNSIIITFSQVFIFIIKNFIKRKRPFNHDKTIENKDKEELDIYSFPSGHSFNALLLYYLLNNKLLILPLLVGFSRVYLGVHYPSDILFGFLLAKLHSSYWLSKY